jgi:hypothetical protein
VPRRGNGHRCTPSQTARGAKLRGLSRADRVLRARTSAFTRKELVDAADWIPSIVALAVNALSNATHHDGD